MSYGVRAQQVATPHSPMISQVSSTVGLQGRIQLKPSVLSSSYFIPSFRYYSY